MSKNYNNELLNDCSWFAEKHRGKNKTSGAHWSTIIRFTPLFDEAVRLQNQFRTLLKSIEVGDAKQMDIDKLQAENERLKEALSSLYEACMKADEQGELSEYVDGSILDRVGEALKEVTK